jgi:hypothetical protein
MKGETQMELVINDYCFYEMNENDLLSIEGGNLFLKIVAGITGGVMIVASPFVGAATGIATFATGPLSLGVAVGTAFTTAGTGAGLLDYAFSK